MAIAKASAQWKGTLKEGCRLDEGRNGFFEAPFTFLSRFEGDKKGTNPEELVGAAAHAGCFSMFLSAQLTNAGKPPKTSTPTPPSPWVTAPPSPRSSWTVVAVVPGVDQGDVRREGGLLQGELPGLEGARRSRRDQGERQARRVVTAIVTDDRGGLRCGAPSRRHYLGLSVIRAGR
jgi:osmotically inducible protein OsmC